MSTAVLREAKVVCFALARTSPPLWRYFGRFSERISR